MSKIDQCAYCHLNRKRNSHHIIPQRFVSTSKTNRRCKRKDTMLLDKLFPEPEYRVNGDTSRVCFECHDIADGLIPLDVLMTPDKYFLLDEMLKRGETVSRETVWGWAEESYPEIKKRRKGLLIEQKREYKEYKQLFFLLAALRQAAMPIIPAS